ncbi:MAG: endolytic transglycosylase MltG [Candidatus Gracilibacteria bacterium]|nr:endolytic transglycosylase MltG [Candidatus Gracilibacteria bacterium]
METRRLSTNNDNNKQNVFFRLFKLFIWIFVIGGIYFYSSYSSFKSQVLTQKETIIRIPKSSTLYDLPKLLTKYDIKLDDFYLKIYVRMGNADGFEFNAGTFKIPAGANIKDLLFSLEKPYVNTTDVTILEGWNIYDIDKYLSDEKLITKGDFIKIAENYSNSENKYSFLTKGKSVEGFLYPDTYEVLSNNFSSKRLIEKMLDNFNRKIGNSLKNLSKKEIYDIITMASIVEKEEKVNKNRPIVAGILYSRIEYGTPIGADITVCYPYELTNKECTPSFIGSHIRDVNDYNTRTMKGLPASPIGNPSVSSINASLEPKNTDYYFYLHDKNGQIHYAKTNAEHEANKRKYIY